MPLSNGGRKLTKLKSRLLSIADHAGAGSFLEIRKTIDDNLKRRTGLSMSNFEKHCTLVTDVGATSPCVFGASVSQPEVFYCERWIHCVVHLLNVAIKKTVTDDLISKTQIGLDFERIMKILKLCKKSSFNVHLRDGSSLIQEVHTCFGMDHDFASLFVKAAAYFKQIIQQHNTDALEQKCSILR